MDKLLITGGRRLDGQVRISGAKNAALPLLVTPLLADGELVIGNVPLLKDVTTILKVLGHMGVTVTMLDQHRVSIDARTLTRLEAPYELVRTMRASMEPSCAQ